MDTLTITEFEPTTLESLRKVAEANGHGAEREAALLILTGLARSDKLTRLERAKAIAAMTPKGVVQTDSTLLIREDRDDPDR